MKGDLFFLSRKVCCIIRSQTIAHGSPLDHNHSYNASMETLWQKPPWSNYTASTEKFGIGGELSGRKASFIDS
jgi:hypothetical protein